MEGDEGKGYFLLKLWSLRRRGRVGKLGEKRWICTDRENGKSMGGKKAEEKKKAICSWAVTIHYTLN